MIQGGSAHEPTPSLMAEYPGILTHSFNLYKNLSDEVRLVSLQHHLAP